MDAIEYDRCIEALEKRIEELEAELHTSRLVSCDKVAELMREIQSLEARLKAVLNAEVPFAGGMVKIRQFGQVQKALEQKDVGM